MYSVTKRIAFCYGHRLLDYAGICKHPHGHNAVAEIEVRTDALDSRNQLMVKDPAIVWAGNGAKLNTAIVGLERLDLFGAIGGQAILQVDAREGGR